LLGPLTAARLAGGTTYSYCPLSFLPCFCMYVLNTCIQKPKPQSDSPPDLELQWTGVTPTLSASLPFCLLACLACWPHLYPACPAPIAPDEHTYLHEACLCLLLHSQHLCHLLGHLVLVGLVVQGQSDLHHHIKVGEEQVNELRTPDHTSTCGMQAAC
jgi:hypothetical protein